MILEKVHFDLIGGPVDDLGLAGHADRDVRRKDRGVSTGIDCVPGLEFELERDLFQEALSELIPSQASGPTAPDSPSLALMNSSVFRNEIA